MSSLNTTCFYGATITQIQKTIKEYQSNIKPDEEIEGIRIPLKENEKYLSPILLSVIEDERKQSE